uniref:HECT-type E3 ubiquitin transferase n=1 Tax=Latimeria chalumnae TaxID=7897 RepID=H3B372_LATCH
ILTCPLSPNESFLRYLTLPQDNDLAIDLRQTAVVVMAHLDRLAVPCMPPQCSSPTSHKGSLQEVVGWGLLGWKYPANIHGPIQCEALANLGVTQIACAEKCFLILTRNGRVYMQAYNSNTLGPQLVQGLASRNITKIAAHPDGQHYLALSATGDVFSWGCGDGGRLGHGDTISLEEPKIISALSGKQGGKHVTHIACGSTYSAAITDEGELYTWGRGNYGRLGHGSSEDQTTPMLVTGLKGLKVIDVSCGSGDAQTLAVTENGQVWSWGDGDYGKLGRGGSDGCKTPKLIEKLQDLNIVKACCGSQFSVALTKDGEVYSWGKGDNQRLGHGTDEHVRYPKLIDTLQGTKIIDVAVGSTHCLVLTEDGEVHSWGSNDKFQHFDTLRLTKPLPTALPGMDRKHIVGISCGPGQSFAWSSCSEWSIGLHVPFVVDVCPMTFEQLDLLLRQVSEGMDGSSDWPPPQEKECMAVATLNLLRLQLHAAISHQVDPECLGLGLGSVLLNSLKQTVVVLASNAGVLNTVQSAAQAVLQSGWSVLLPTAEERARALSALLPNAVSGNEMSVSPGRRFMIDLLVSSLMADGGLESALNAAITAEIQDIEAKKEAQKEKEIDEQEANASSLHRSRTPLDKDLINTGIYESAGKQSLPLVQLVQQLLRNIASQTIAKLKDVAHRISSCLDNEHYSRERSASLDLLLRFQRLLVSKLYPDDSDTCVFSDYSPELLGVGSLLKKYIALLCTHISDILPVASSISSTGHRHFAEVSRIVEGDLTGVLLPELVVSIILLLSKNAGLMQEAGAIPLLAGLLEHLDRINHLAPGSERDDNEDLAWPGIMGSFFTGQSSRNNEEVTLIRKADLENHNKDGGFWTVIDGKVYDIKDFQAQSLTGNSILAQYAGEDPVVALEAALQFENTRESMQAFCVGQYMEPDQEAVTTPDLGSLSSPLIDTERNLGLLLGLHASYLAMSTPLSPVEVECASKQTFCFVVGRDIEGKCSYSIKQSKLLLNKKMVKFFAENAALLCIVNMCNVVKNFHIFFFFLKDFLCQIERYCKQCHLTTPITFPPEHPVEEVGRLLLCCLLKHQDLVLTTITSRGGHRALRMIFHDTLVCKMLINKGKQLIQIKSVSSSPQKSKLTKNRVVHTRSELRPAVSNDLSIVSKLKLLSSLPRWRRIVFYSGPYIAKDCMLKYFIHCCVVNVVHGNQEYFPSITSWLPLNLLIFKNEIKCMMICNPIYCSLLCMCVILYKIYIFLCLHKEYEMWQLFIESVPLRVEEAIVYSIRGNATIRLPLNKDSATELKNRSWHSHWYLPCLPRLKKSTLMNTIVEFALNWQRLIPEGTNIGKKKEKKKNSLYNTHTKILLVGDAKDSILLTCTASVRCVLAAAICFFRAEFFFVHFMSQKSLLAALIFTLITIHMRIEKANPGSKTITNDNPAGPSLGTIPQARFLLVMLNMLTLQHGANSLSLLLNSGMLALTQTALRLIDRMTIALNLQLLPIGYRVDSLKFCLNVSLSLSLSLIYDMFLSAPLFLPRFDNAGPRTNALLGMPLANKGVMIFRKEEKKNTCFTNNKSSHLELGLFFFFFKFSCLNFAIKNFCLSGSPRGIKSYANSKIYIVLTEKCTEQNLFCCCKIVLYTVCTYAVVTDSSCITCHANKASISILKNLSCKIEKSYKTKVLILGHWNSCFFFFFNTLTVFDMSQKGVLQFSSSSHDPPPPKKKNNFTWLYLYIKMQQTLFKKKKKKLKCSSRAGPSLIFFLSLACRHKCFVVIFFVVVILALRLLQAVLPSWDKCERSRDMKFLVIYHCLEVIIAEIVALLRTLHSLNQWNGLINEYINSQLNSISHIMAVGCAQRSVHLHFKEFDIYINQHNPILNPHLSASSNQNLLTVPQLTLVWLGQCMTQWQKRKRWAWVCVLSNFACKYALVFFFFFFYFVLFFWGEEVGPPLSSAEVTFSKKYTAQFDTVIKITYFKISSINVTLRSYETAVFLYHLCLTKRILIKPSVYQGFYASCLTVLLSGRLAYAEVSAAETIHTEGSPSFTFTPSSYLQQLHSLHHSSSEATTPVPVQHVRPPKQKKHKLSPIPPLPIVVQLMEMGFPTPPPPQTKTKKQINHPFCIKGYKSLFNFVLKTNESYHCPFLSEALSWWSQQYKFKICNSNIKKQCKRKSDLQETGGFLNFPLIQWSQLGLLFKSLDDSTSLHHSYLYTSKCTIILNIFLHDTRLISNQSQWGILDAKSKVIWGKKPNVYYICSIINRDRNTTVPLLSDCTDYHRYIEIAIKQCRSSGIDCKVHGLSIAGRIRAEDEDLAAVPFLASDNEEEDDDKTNSGSLVRKKAAGLESVATIRTKVFVWGLNDKDQLGGLKGSKIKVPSFSETQSALNVVQVAGGSKSLFAVTAEGKVYACGEATNGRLGLGLSSGTIPIPRQITALSNYVVKKVAVHSGGRHAMALTVDGKVFSWGEGDDGKLGHFSRMNCDKPRLIEALKTKRIRDIACGSSHSAAITSSGELYTWGLGEYGRLGHGDNTTQLKPKLVKALLGHRVIQVACGSRDAQTLALTDEGLVFSWGDGDFGKLGRGGSEGCNIPQNIERLNGQGVCQIECGAQFSLALTKSGVVWTWYVSKETSFNLKFLSGHSQWKLCRHRIVAMSVNCTQSLFVYAWGDNDHGQQGNGTTTVNRKPTLVQGLEGQKITRVACGSSHSVAWTTVDVATPSVHEPVLFQTARDPLGASYLGGGGGEVKPNIAQNSSSGAASWVPKNQEMVSAVLNLQKKKKKQPKLPNFMSHFRNLICRDAVVGALMPASMIAPVECPSSSPVPPADTSPVMSPVNGEELQLAVGLEDRLSPNPWQDRRGEVASSEDAVTPSSAVTPSASAASSRPFIPVTDDPGAASIIAETMTKTKEVLKDVESQSKTSGPEPQYLDEFSSLLVPDDTRVMVDLLKLAVSSRAGEKGKEVLSAVLSGMGTAYPQVADMLLELCVTELEDVATDSQSGRLSSQPVVVESSHPYTDDTSTNGTVKIPGAEGLRVEFDRQCSTERRHDPLTIMDGANRIVSIRSGREWSDWSSELRIPGDELKWKFTSDGSVNGWGWRFTVYPIMPAAGPKDLLSDRCILSCPSMDLVTCLLDFRLNFASNRGIVPRLAASLAACAQLSALAAGHRMWALQRLRKLLTTEFGQSININRLLGEGEGEVRSMSFTGSALAALVKGLPEALQRQFEYEDPIVRGGKQLLHSPFFKVVLVALACDLELDTLPCCAETHKWAWFRRYCMASRVAVALDKRTSLPRQFLDEVAKKIRELMADNENMNVLHESHDVFKREQDEHLVQWMNRRPDDWTLSAGGSGTIYGWGHNHRGQLGGIEGAKVKVPTPCEALAALRPVQLIGGEQTLFAVTADGKLYATGYGAGGRLGIGGTESVSTPTLLESIQHVFIKKVAVNSGGKHCLALSSEGEVYSWGEAEDGKLGHGNRSPCDRPRVIESLRGIEVVDIAAGGAHSACITAAGELYTWGKGRYGRLGHGDSEDQLKPKLVEALQGYRVIDVACGSGDAQTLCLTDDDTVWSWGDGDYGKLGRGGSDGCKVPMKIDSLTGLGVTKVECGSQFSVALTKSGAVYTWGKGDYHRLGHGSDDHVRRPRQVQGLQGKKVIAIATGSLHCVCCTEDGEVYTWGDNDEGQLGDGTTNAIQRPRLVAALQGKKINRVACGSAHTLAWSTSKPANAGKLPAQVPMEYNHLQEIPIIALRNRLLLLHHISELFCPCIPMFDLEGRLGETGQGPSVGFDTLRGILISQGKEAAFRKVVQATMVRDRQHGPVVELNRIQVKRSRSKGGLAGPDGTKSVFGQMCAKMSSFSPDSLLLPHRVWKVKFVGESVDDCGGGYSESIAEMCEELQNGLTPLLIVTPNGRDESGANRDCFLLNPAAKSPLHMNMFRFLGVLLGIAIRTGSPLSLNLAEPVWKQLAGMNLTIADLSEVKVDKDFIPGLMYIRDNEATAEEFEAMVLPFTVPSASGQDIQLSSKYTHIVQENRAEYVRLAINYRLHEFDEQVAAVREGMARVVPVPLLSLFTGYELETMVCGSPDIPLHLLKSVATYKGIEPTAALIQWFWEVMESFSNTERSLFLRFVWGRTRLPRTIADFRGRDFVVQVLDKYNPPDHFLPESYTCFFLLKLPRYSCKQVLEEKLKYAIHFCKSIDTDDYARIALTGEPAADDSTDDSDNEDADSFASDSTQDYLTGH